ncbi:MAG TPA: cytidylate kinase-like family protein [Vicinamibacterales bacterium]
MKVRVVTIDREYGSGANVIAKRLADRLGWKLWDQLLTNEVARLARCERSQVANREERMDPLYYRFLKSFLRGSFEGSLNVNRLNLLDADTIFRLTWRIVTAASEEGNAVIVGRGSPFFLENRPDAFHVFIYAPYEDKVRRLISGGTEPNEAARLVDTVDNDRADFIKRYFDKEWPDRHLYHLMINSRVGDEAVVRTILNGIATHEGQAAPPHSAP